MTKREKIILVFSLIMLLAGAGIFFYKKGSGSSSNDLLNIKLTSVKLANGWGYDIKVGTDFAIHQDRIPTIPGNKAFVSEEDALRTGRLVVDKLQHRKPPMVTLQELKALEIHY
jgi:outer membrane protein W